MGLKWHKNPNQPSYPDSSDEQSCHCDIQGILPSKQSFYHLSLTMKIFLVIWSFSSLFTSVWWCSLLFPTEEDAATTIFLWLVMVKGAICVKIASQHSQRHLLQEKRQCSEPGHDYASRVLLPGKWWGLHRLSWDSRWGQRTWEEGRKEGRGEQTRPSLHQVLAIMAQ